MIETPQHWTFEQTATHLLKESLLNQRLQMAAIDDLKANIQKLQASVENLAAKVTRSDDVQAAAALVSELQTKVDSIVASA
jgi:uncharacterized small protein (DUF1192 family)